MARALIADTCFYEDNPDTARHIDYVKMKSAGVSGVIVRAGQREWVDTSFRQSWSDAKKAGLPRGTYWFYDSRATPQAQAQLWYDTMKTTSDYGELPLFCDYEENYNGAYKGGYNFKIFIEEVQRLMPEKEIMIYTGYWYWKDNMPISLHSFFAQFGLWIAAYNNVAPQIPAPWYTKERQWDFWQFTEDGSGDIYGTEGKVDLNWFNGSLSEFKTRFNITDKPEPPKPNDEVTETHKGVKLHKLQRFGTTVWVHVIDPSLATIEVSDCGYKKPSYAQDFYGAQIVSNGGGWPNIQDSTHRSNEMWVSNGYFMQLPPYIKDNRPYINVDAHGVITVVPNAQTIPSIYNAVGFDRLLVINGKFNTIISDRTTKDARTASGVTADNKFVLLNCEGNDYKLWGLTFEEMATILIEFKVINGGNNDGGSSTSVINTAISKDPLFVGSDGVEAPVINHILVFAEPISEPEPEEPVENEYIVVQSARFRSQPTINTTDTGSSSVIGEKFISTVKQVDVNNPTVTMVRHTNGKWLPLEYRGTVYTKLTGEEPVPTIITRKLEIDTVSGKIRIDGGSWQ